MIKPENEKWVKLLNELQDAYEVVREENVGLEEQAVKDLDYSTRLLVTAWTIRKICEHAKEGGSYRTLIYDRLQFGPDAYVILYDAGGMEINNHFNLE